MRNEYDFSKGKRGAVIKAPGKEQVTIMFDDDKAISSEAALQSQESLNSLKLTKLFRESWNV